MSGRIVFMTEEESMERALRELLPKVTTDFREGEHWLILSHEGKRDLEKSYPRKMRAWREPGVRFIILRDNDGADCRVLKERLISRIAPGAPGYLVRIVCQELESWFLGDLEALSNAYPGATRERRWRRLTSKDPDTLGDASELVGKLTRTKAKCARATEIASRMDPGRNRSGSFRVFVDGLNRLLSE